VTDDAIHSIIMIVASATLYNGHYYQSFASPVTFASALSLAAASTLYGVTGHLVTISSAGENSLVTGLNSNSWVAAHDTAAEGVFKHAAGPEAGLALSYTAWALNQPDDYLGDEDCVFLGIGVSLPNNWNDLICTSLQSYVIEYECASGQAMSASGCPGLIGLAIVSAYALGRLIECPSRLALKPRLSSCHSNDLHVLLLVVYSSWVRFVALNHATHCER
jgi:hypothetical protein